MVIVLYLFSVVLIFIVRDTERDWFVCVQLGNLREINMFIEYIYIYIKRAFLSFFLEYVGVSMCVWESVVVFILMVCKASCDGRLGAERSLERKEIEGSSLVFYTKVRALCLF